MPENNKTNDAVLVRWIAIAGAAGAAIASGFAQWSKNEVWQGLALILALLAVAGIAGLWHAFGKRTKALVVAAEKTHEQKREVTALNEELAVHREMEKELIVARQAAESAMMAKGEFLATMSHEIRTPLNGIIPMLDILMSAKLPPDQHDVLRTAYTSAGQMLRIVDDILDYSKLEANKLQLETTSFNLRELCDSIIMLMERSAESKGLRLHLQIDSNVRLPVRGDPVRLRQVLTNLLSNAIKFTERGSVTLSVTRKSETQVQHELRIEVHDTGIGISPQGITQLFRPFSQADASTTRLYGGTGLGLVICKRIVDLMGGTIGVDSETGRGATFWINLPMLKAAGDMNTQRKDLNGARVLLLSNDAVLKQRMQQVASAWGCQITGSDSTQDALAQLRTAITRSGTWTFDVLLVDMNSVRSTAIALHRNLRRTPDFEALRVVYLTGNDPLPDELQDGPYMFSLPRVMQANEMRTGISNFLSSAAKRSDTRLNEPLQAPAPTSTNLLASTDATKINPADKNDKKLRGHLLLVEDNPVNLMVAQRLIGMLGLDCETADNGEKALTRMKAGHLDLVLMDCQMPVKDGYVATQEWRQHEAAHNLPRLPIIAMTANAMAGDRQKCLDAGMDDYITKPVDRRLLETTLASWLQTRRELLQSGASTSATADITKPTLVKPLPAPSKPTVAPALATAASKPTLPTTTTVAAPPARVQASTPVAAAMPQQANASAASAPAKAPSLPVLAPEVLEELEFVMGNEYLGLIKLFLEDAPKQIQELEQAAAENNIHGMIGPSHTLKSSSANLGALALSALAKRIEVSARGNTLNRPTVAVVMLAAEYKKAQQALQSKLNQSRVQ